MVAPITPSGMPRSSITSEIRLVHSPSARKRSTAPAGGFGVEVMRMRSAAIRPVSFLPLSSVMAFPLSVPLRPTDLVCERMDAGVKARHGISANAPLSRGFVYFGRPGRARLPVFLLPSNEGNGAPGGASGALRGSLRPVCETSLCVVLPGPKSLEGGGDPGTHGPVRRALRLPTLHRRHALSAAAPCSVIRCRDRRRPRLSKAWRT